MIDKVWPKTHFRRGTKGDREPPVGLHLTLSGASHWQKQMVHVHIFTRRPWFVEHFAIYNNLTLI